MRNGKNALHAVLVGLVVACLSTPVSSFAQGARRPMGPPPAAPKATVMTTGAWQTKSIDYLKASDSGEDFQFGTAVAVSGDGNTMAVGAVGETSASKGINSVPSGNAPYSGAVHVYSRSATGWKQQAYVKASNTAEGAQFGGSVALSKDGNLLAVGAPGESSAAKGINGDQNDRSIDDAGAVYLFTRNGTMWTQQAYVKASNTFATDTGYAFGTALALSADGKTLAVGSAAEASNGWGVNGNQTDHSAQDAGAVYTFVYDGNNWSQQGYLKPWNTTAGGGLFGYAVGLSGNGDTLAVGAQNEDATRGGVYVFRRAHGVWSQETRFPDAPNAEGDDQLGCSVAISDDGNTIVSGACEEDALLVGIQPPTAGGNDRSTDVSTGAAYVWVHGADGRWSLQTYMKSFNTRVNDQFGWSLAMSGDGNTIAVGAHYEDSGAKGINGDMTDFSMEDAGAVYIYTRSGNTWVPTSYVKPSNTEATEEFGTPVAISTDGKVLVVGATKENRDAKGINGRPTGKHVTNAGAAYVYY